MEACDAVSLLRRRRPKLGRAYVGVEHILLGLLKVEDCVAAQVLMSLGITLGNAHGRLLKLVSAGPEQEPPDAHGRGPFVALGRRVLDCRSLRGRSRCCRWL